MAGKPQQMLVGKERGVGGDHDLRKGVSSDISNVRRFQIRTAIPFNIRTDYIRQNR